MIFIWFNNTTLYYHIKQVGFSIRRPEVCSLIKSQPNSQFDSQSKREYKSHPKIIKILRKIPREFFPQISEELYNPENCSRFTMELTLTFFHLF